MRPSKNYFRTTSCAAVLVLACHPSWAGELRDAPLLGIAGDGFIFADPSEGVLEPGIKAVTQVPNENDWEINPRNPSSPRGILNCLMANNPGILCDAPPGSGKRVKTRLTGPVPFDMRLGVTPSNGVTSYFTYGKTSNLTGARITNFAFVLGTGTGANFVPLNSEGDVLFDTDLIPRFNLPDGLFGNGGQESTGVGFFDATEATMAQTNGLFQITTDSLTNDFLVANFGTALLDNSMIPDGLFWNASGTALPDDEPVLIAWYNISAGAWQYGNLGVEEWSGSGPEPDDFAPLSARLAALAQTLGVEVGDLGTDGTDGAQIPADIVAAMIANGLFEVLPVEDIRNMNLNFMLDVGDIDGGEFTLRIVPVFAPIVNAAQNAFQFTAAGYLDGAANVPYWDIGNAAEYQEAISEILALAPAEQARALTSTAVNIAPAFSSLGFEAGQDQIAALTNMAPLQTTGDVASQFGGAQSWSLGNGLYGLFSAGGSSATYDPTVGSVGYDVSTTSFTVGLERSVSNTASIGLALGAANATADAASALGDIETDAISLTAFTRAQFGDGGAVQALFGYQDLSYTSSRAVMGETARGRTDGTQTYGALKMDYLRNMGRFRVGPTASVAFHSVDVDGFTETGANIWNLTVEDQTGDTFIGTIGLKGDYLFGATSGQNRLTGSVTYSRFSTDDLVIESGFDGLPTTSFNVDGISEDLVDVNLGFESVISASAARDIKISAGYGGSFGDGYERHGFQIGLNANF